MYYLYSTWIEFKKYIKGISNIQRLDRKRVVMCLYGCIHKSAEYPIYKCKRISAFIIDEPVIRIGNQHFWLWFCIEPIHLSTWNIHIY